MKVIIVIPTREEAERLLVWGGEQNPGIWEDHSRVVARVAETIAGKCGLDTEKAYILGLLHDIGRFAGVRKLYHVYAGYKLLKSKGYLEAAEICISHSFPLQDINEYFGANDCTPEETDVINTHLSGMTFTEYDKLIQLCDSMGASGGVTLMQVRWIDVIRRYGFAELTLQKLDALLALKEHFDELCGMNIYDLFYDEIRDVSFR